MVEFSKSQAPSLPRVIVAYVSTSSLLALAWRVTIPSGLWIVNAFAAVVGIGLARFALGPEWRKVLGWSTSNLSLGIGLGALMIAATQLLARELLPNAHLSPVLAETRRLYALLDAPPGPIEAAPIIWLVVVAEELVYRGVITTVCERRMSTAATLLSSVALYVLPLAASGSWLLVAVGITAGTLWTFVRMRTSGVLVPLVAHAMWSCSTFIAFPVVEHRASCLAQTKQGCDAASRDTVPAKKPIRRVGTLKKTDTATFAQDSRLG